MLPRRHAAWQDALKQLQDLLGEMHDLHVLDGFVERELAGGEAAAVLSLRQAISEQIQARVDQYGAHTSVETNVLQEWREGLPQGARIRGRGLGETAGDRARGRPAPRSNDRSLAPGVTGLRRACDRGRGRAVARPEASRRVSRGCPASRRSGWG